MYNIFLQSSLYSLEIFFFLVQALVPNVSATSGEDNPSKNCPLKQLKGMTSKLVEKVEDWAHTPPKPLSRKKQVLDDEYHRNFRQLHQKVTHKCENYKIRKAEKKAEAEKNASGSAKEKEDQK